jgi:excisionase family DNA binding protein
MEMSVRGELPPLLRVEEVCKLLRIGRTACYQAAAAGEIPTIRIGRRVFIPTARLMAFLGVTASEAGGEGVQIVRGEMAGVAATDRVGRESPWRS